MLNEEANKEKCKYRGFKEHEPNQIVRLVVKPQQTLLEGGLSTLVPDIEPAAVQVMITEENLGVELADGRAIVVPLEWYPRLLYGSPEERQNWQLLGDVYAVECPDLDEYIGMEGLLAGSPRDESQKSFERWLAGRMLSCTVDQNKVVV